MRRALAGRSTRAWPRASLVCRRARIRGRVIEFYGGGGGMLNNQSGATFAIDAPSTFGAVSVAGLQLGAGGAVSGNLISVVGSHGTLQVTGDMTTPLPDSFRSSPAACHPARNSPRRK